MEKIDFTGFNSPIRFEQTEVEKESVVLTKPSEFKSQYTFHEVKFKNKKVPDMIDYNNDIQCGPLQPRNSKDMMIRTIKNYLIDKYIFGSFMKPYCN